MPRAIPLNRLPAVCECGAHGWALLSRGFVTFFSPGKLPLVEGRVWSQANVGGKKKPQQYAVHARAGCNLTYMHRVLTGAELPLLVDHKDGKGLNNFDNNLRPCTRSSNGQNSRAHSDKQVPFKGVYERQGKFVASITPSADEKLKHLGTFSCPIEAARAYDRAALGMHKSFALTNAMLGLIPATA